MNPFFSLFFTRYAVNRIKCFSQKKKKTPQYSLSDSALAFRSCFQPERDKKETCHLPSAVTRTLLNTAPGGGLLPGVTGELPL